MVITGSHVRNVSTAFSSFGIKVTNSVVNENAVAAEGGGVIEGSTLANNETALLGRNSPEIRNSIIWCGGAAGACALLNVPPSNISHSLVPDPALHGVDGNIFADPRFVNGQDRDFRLKPDSPCIDAGFNSPDLPQFDIAGMHRVIFGGKSLTVDMGAYEFYINKLDPVPGTSDAVFTWSSLADKTYSILYTDDLLTWQTAIADFASSGNTTTSWTDDGSLTGVPPLLAPKRFYRILENP